MKKPSVGQAHVQGNNRKGGELHFISPRNETYLLNSFSQPFRGQSFTTPDTGGGYSWRGGGNWKYEVKGQLGIRSFRENFERYGLL